MVLVGLQYGDEGKGKILDFLLKYKKYNIVARFNGGANAGHTLEVNNTKIALHQIPSGIFYKNIILYYGSGCVLDPIKLNEEIRTIESKNIKLSKRLVISPNVPLVKPSDILRDKIIGIKIGTTSNGIGPAYADMAIRSNGEMITNIRLGDYLSNPLKFRKEIQKNLSGIIKKYNIRNIDIIKLSKRFHRAVLKLKRYVVPDPLFLEKLLRRGKKVIFEGANSTMLDPVYGAVPFVTSSRTLASAAYTGGDTSIKHDIEVVGVVKAIMSRVGNGPFASEFGGRKSELYCAEEKGYAHTKEKEYAEYPDPKELLKSKDEFTIGRALRMLSGEYGATTKRPRRIGALDLVMIKQNALLNGVNSLFINKVDCLIYFKETPLKGIPVVIAYKLKGKIIDYMPTNEETLRKVVPVIKYLPFIKTDISNIRNEKDLPKEVLTFVRFIEKQTGIVVKGIGIGPKREQIILLSNKKRGRND